MNNGQHSILDEAFEVKVGATPAAQEMIFDTLVNALRVAMEEGFALETVKAEPLVDPLPVMLVVTLSFRVPN